MQRKLHRNMQTEMFHMNHIPWEEALMAAKDEAKERAADWLQNAEIIDLAGKYLSKDGAKWRLASALQKAIRRGYVEESAHIAAAFFDMDKQYLIYRMATIACEDVGMSNFEGLEVFSAVADNIDLRKNRERQIYAQLAANWASGIKDRCATELCVLDDHGTQFQKKAVDKYKSAMTLYSQALAQVKYGRESLHQFWLSREGDPRVLYVTDVLLRRQRTMIPIGLMPVARMIGNQLPVWEADEYPWECQKIGKLLPAATFDKHTREGKRAIATWCNKTGQENKAGTGMVVFTSEGSLVDRRLVYPGSKLLVKEAKAAIDAIPAESNLSKNEAEAILGELVENAELLHELRIWAYSKAK